MVSDGQTCSDTVYKDVLIIHPCAVTPLSRYISMSYAGGIGTIEILSNCQWDLRKAIEAPYNDWFHLLTPAGTYSGNQTITFQFDPIPYGGIPNFLGRNQALYIGDKDVFAYQEGWGDVGTDIFRDGKADILWRNASNGIVWAQPMDGLTAGAGATIAGASSFPLNGPDFRIATSKNDSSSWWTIYWRNVATADYHLQKVKGSTDASTALTQAQNPEFITYDNTNWRPLGVGGVDSGANDYLLRRDYSTGIVSHNSNGGTGPFYWYEPDLNWKVVAVEDFDGSYDDEVLWRHAVSGTVFMTRAGGRESAVVHYEPNLDWQIVAAGDVTADDKADIVWRNSANGTVWVQAMDGFRSIGGGVVWRDADPNWQIQGMADFDGNGSKDLLWRHATTGTVFVVLLNRDFTVAGSGVVHYEPNLDWKIVTPTKTERIANGNH